MGQLSMNTVISTYLRNDPSLESISKAARELKSILDSGHLGRLSPSLLEAFLLGKSSILLFISTTKTPDSEVIFSLLNRLVINDLLVLRLLPEHHLKKLIQYIFSAMQNNAAEGSWKAASDLLTSSPFAFIFLTVSPVLELFQEFFLSSISDPETNETLKLILLKSFLLRLVDFGVNLLLVELSVDLLESVMQLVDIVVSTMKLSPASSLTILNHLSNDLHAITSCTKLVQLRGADGRFDFKRGYSFPFPKFLQFSQSFLKEAPCEILSLWESLINLFPQFPKNQDTFQQLCQLLMRAIRLPPSSSTLTCKEEDKENLCRLPSPALRGMKVLDRLVVIVNQISLPSDIHTNQLCQLFDLLRVFPCYEEHAEVRLQSWWHFICHLPQGLLSDGFRRFVSPFLANLLGRYLSISTPMGDPELHHYKLSGANAYEGNQNALRLAQHVFACFFRDSPNLSLEFTSKLPRLQVDENVLAKNSYQLLVALAHWLHLIAGSNLPEDGVPKQPVDTIWIGCVRLLLQMAANLPQSVQQSVPPTLRSPSVNMKTDQSLLLTVSQHVVCTTAYVVSLMPSATVTRSSDPLPGSPSPTEALNILEEVGDALMTLPLSTHEKSEVFFDLLLKLCELGIAWIKREGVSPELSPADLDSLLNGWCDLTIRFLNSDPRLAGDSDGDVLHLIHQLLLALVPDAVQLAARHSSFESVSQDSSLSVFLGKVPTIVYSSQSLRILAELLDRVTHFVVVHHRICEADPVAAPDLTTLQAMHLAPFWFAGATVSLGGSNLIDSEPTYVDGSHLSNIDELALAKRLSILFMAFHQEACLLTTVASNSWIDQLGQKFAALISVLPDNPAEHLNLNLLGRLLKTFAQNAERVEESASSDDAFNPFRLNPTPNRPFGQLTGLLQALKLCLHHFPWPHPPAFSQQPSSPIRRTPPRSNPRILCSPPMLPLTTEASLSTVDDSCSSISRSQQLSLSERIASTTHKVSCGLIDALDAVNILLLHHIRSPEHLVYLIDTLNPTLASLATSCARADAAVLAASTELDEPLLVTQRRQQAKNTLEEIFVNLWRSLGCTPVTNLPTDLNELMPSGKKAAKSTGKSIPLAPHQCCTLLHAGLTLCQSGSIPHTPNAALFVQWFIGFWQSLLVTATPPAKHWNPVRKSLEENESIICSLLSSLQSAAQKSNLISDNAVVPKLKKDPDATVNSDTISSRGRRGRLSLGRKSAMNGPATPDQKGSRPPSKTLTLSAPPAVSSIRGRGRRSMLSLTGSPDRSPGILATALGIRPGINPLTGESSWPTTPTKPCPLPGRPLLKRRLFMDDEEKTDGIEPSKKRTHPDSSTAKVKVEDNGVLRPPNPADFEDSAQFVFIPPAPDHPRKRNKTLTAHQKEKFREQKLEYVPITYTELDCSQQSVSDSQSESQSQFSSQSANHLMDSAMRVAGESEPVKMEEAGGSQDLRSKQAESCSDSFEELVDDTPNVDFPSEAVDKVETSLSASKTDDHDDKAADDLSGPIDLPESQETASEQDMRNRDPVSVLSPKPQLNLSPDVHAVASPNQSASNLLPLPFRLKSSVSSPTPNAFNLSANLSPLIRSSSSRAQRMLALGLQKAAEQSAQRRISLLNSPPTPDDKEKPKDKAESPPSILRGISAKKKLQRVSFADEPTIFTFGSPRSPDSDPRFSTPPRRVQRDASPTNEVVTDGGPEALEPQVEPGNDSSATLCVPVSVDLDSSQNNEHMGSPTGSPVASSNQHRRKSESPQRRDISRKIPLHGVNLKRDSIKPVLNTLFDRPAPKRRRLFTTDEQEVSTESAVSNSSVIAPDSEPIEIVDTQPVQEDPDSPSPGLTTDDQEEQLFVQSSQSTQDSALTGETRPIEQEESIQKQDTGTCDQSEVQNGVDKDTSIEDVEEYVTKRLNEIEAQLPALPAERRDVVLLKALAVLKAIIP